MLHLFKLNRDCRFVHGKLIFFCTFTSEPTSQSHSLLEKETEIDRIVKIINDHPFPDHPLHPTLLQDIPPSVLSTSLVENVLGRLFAAHSNGLKALEFFRLSLQNPKLHPSSDAFEKTLHILARMRYFDKAWELMEEIRQLQPSLLTLKSISIMLSRIAKFCTFEETLAAFERMEKSIFLGKEFGTEEFNIMLRAICTQRQMKEAKSVFNKMHPRFSPNTKTMNILLLGFKESGDVTSVELFYHEMVRRGFKPNNVTYNIRIDTYCKRGCFADGLRLLKEMEGANCSPTIETITTLIHGAGVARNTSKARELFDEIPMRNLIADVGAYNALISSLIKSRDVNSAVALMDEMEEKGIGHDNITYHTMFFGLMKSRNVDSVLELYETMVRKNFMPKTRTVVMLMKFLCEQRRSDLALGLWSYLLEGGQCPHGHALDLLATALCSKGKLQEAFVCCKQILHRGRHLSDSTFRMMERFLVQAGNLENLQELDRMIKRLHTVLPPSRGHATGHSSPTELN